MMHQHDWGIAKRIESTTGATILVICADCHAPGVITDATPLEIRKAITAALDSTHRPQYTGASTRVHGPGSPAFNSIDWTTIVKKKKPESFEEFLRAGQPYLACKEWIRTHAPCTEDEFFEKLVPLLPIGKTRRGFPRSPKSVAAEALRRLPLEIDNGVILGLRTKVKT